MGLRGMVRVMVRAVVSTALVLTVCEVVASAPAHADPVVILESPPTTVGGGGNTLIVQTTDLNVSASITVDNPGTTTPTGQQCMFISPSIGSYCLGSSDQLQRPDDIVISPAEVQGPDSWPYRLPGEGMDWIVDEAVAAIGAMRGIESPELVRAFARADIRAYVVGRLQTIVNKKLYGQTLTDKELAAYADLQAIFKDKLVKDSKWSLEEYDKWNANPCGYTAPAPPAGSGLAAVPNDAQNSTMCSAAGSRFAVWQVTKGTPETSTFDTWAAYRHPTPAMKHLQDPRYRRAYSDTYGAAWLMGAYGASIIGGVAITAALSTLSAAAVQSVAGALGIWGPIAAGSSTFAASALGIGVLVGGVVAALIAVLVTFAIAVWQLTEEAKKGAALRDRVTASAADNDPLDVEKSAPDYVGLDFATLQDPADAAKKAYIHSESFTTSLMSLVQDWQLFSVSGNLIPDPTTGFAYTPSATDANVHFQFQGQAQVQPFITVAAPPGTLDVQNRPLSGYRVGISHGMLMVSDLVTGGTFQPYVPRTRVAFVDAAGHTGWMSLMQVGQTNGPPIRQFQFAVTDGNGVTTNTGGTSWTYSSGAAGPKTVTLAETLPVTPQVNVIPSIQGNLIADNLVQLDSNVSTPGLSKTGGAYAWDVERLDEKGNVVEHITKGDFVAWQTRFAIPGDYRAKVTYSWTGPQPGSVTGRVDFAIVRPAAEAHRSFSLVEDPRIEDDRVNTGALSLDLRMIQNTRSETFDVEVAWADDGMGNEIVKPYTVECVNAGGDTCDTGPLISPGPNQPPTNPQWSEAPTFQIPDDQNFLPHVTVTVTNSYGETITRVFAITGDHRPKYADNTPYVEMPAGTTTPFVDVVQVFPSDSFPPPADPQIDQLQINPFMQGIVDQLPKGVTPQIVKKPNGEWWLQLHGEPTADSIGPWTFYYPFEQNVDVGNARRPAPALVTLEVVSSTTAGYRGIIRGAPQDLSDRVYREGYPDWMVQAAQRLPGDVGEFSDFTGTVMCKLEGGGNVIFDKPCAANQPFPWPTQVLAGSQFASVYLQSDSEPISADGPYTVNLIGNFLDPSVTIEPVDIGDTTATVKLRVDDVVYQPTGVVPPPFSDSDYLVSCSVDGGAYAPCLDSGQGTVPSSPGNHTLDVKVTAPAPNAATVIRRATWSGGPLLTVGVTPRPTTASALKAVFDLSVAYDGAVAPPYTGFSVKCLADGKAVACSSGTLSLLRVPGAHVLKVSSTAPAPDSQSVTKTLNWSVATPAKRLTVRADATTRRRGKLRVQANGLLPMEKYVVRLAGAKVAAGKAKPNGTIDIDVLVPRGTPLGKVKVVVQGATRKRTGSDVVRVVAGRSMVEVRAERTALARILV